jgi:hypothetical protein
MLSDLGWVKLKPGINPLTASERDIAVNVKKLKIVQLEAAQLPRSRSDVDFAVINGNYATSSGIKLTEAVFQEKSYAYVNWGVVRAADAKPWARDVIAAYNSKAFSDWAKRNTRLQIPARLVNRNPCMRPCPDRMGLAGFLVTLLATRLERRAMPSVFYGCGDPALVPGGITGGGALCSSRPGLSAPVWHQPRHGPGCHPGPAGCSACCHHQGPGWGGRPPAARPAATKPVSSCGLCGGNQMNMAALFRLAACHQQFVGAEVVGPSALRVRPSSCRMAW